MQLLKEVPLYNDVMLPSTTEKLPLPLSPLAPSTPSPALVKMESGGEDFSFSSSSRRTPDTANTPSSSTSSSEVVLVQNLLFGSVIDTIMAGGGVPMMCWNCFLSLSLQPSSPPDYFHVDSDICSEFKLDLVEKMFATDTNANTQFNTHVRLTDIFHLPLSMQHFVMLTLNKLHRLKCRLICCL